MRVREQKMRCEGMRREKGGGRTEKGNKCEREKKDIVGEGEGGKIESR